MSKDWNFKSGDWWAICDVCGVKMKASHAKHRWDGLIVCDKDFEQRHPQDFIKVRQDKMTVPFSRPRPPDVFNGFNSSLTPVTITYQGNTLTCSPMDSFSTSGEAVAGCAIAGKILPGTL